MQKIAQIGKKMQKHSTAQKGQAKKVQKKARDLLCISDAQKPSLKSVQSLRAVQPKVVRNHCNLLCINYIDGAVAFGTATKPLVCASKMQKHRFQRSGKPLVFACPLCIFDAKPVQPKVAMVIKGGAQ